MITIRPATPDDLAEITELFYQTITLVNSKDYDPRQIESWAANAKNTNGWLQRLQEQYFILAEIEKEIVGFGSVAKDGYLDLLYVHHAFQRQGVARRLLDSLEQNANECKLASIYSDVSITARPFFEKHGYHIEQEQSKDVNGVIFRNFLMRKKFAL
jgi:putative acetyltransferase